ncbi:hypothetical protein LMG19083_03933 [Ralstonia psammae]|uniref:Uncharacterized protein n=1 Tax=Ralstonia psammae TaxID=3058598 RepID=A0ABM9JUD3_9RALS|nr:hypothetical protein [Ralstonia sp. LMG 19083]CAJ0803720.1 hypothetical protein LMG19083_03933 [Ralstonia sp. LMG 19083]
MIEKADLDEIVGREIIGVAINPYSVSMSFGDNNSTGWILIQCDFSLKILGEEHFGSAADQESAAFLKKCLGEKVIGADFGGDSTLSLYFDKGGYLRMIPMKDGLESYVLHTRNGIVPISDC